MSKENQTPTLINQAKAVATVDIPSYGVAKFYPMAYSKEFASDLESLIYHSLYGKDIPNNPTKPPSFFHLTRLYKDSVVYFPMPISSSDLNRWSRALKTDELETLLGGLSIEEMLVEWKLEENSPAFFLQKMKEHDKLNYPDGYMPNSFAFPNRDRDNEHALNRAFGMRGRYIIDKQKEMCGMLLTVMLDDSSLWQLDMSHGGGGYFVRESKP